MFDKRSNLGIVMNQCSYPHFEGEGQRREFVRKFYSIMAGINTIN